MSQYIIICDSTIKLQKQNEFFSWIFLLGYQKNISDALRNVYLFIIYLYIYIYVLIIYITYMYVCKRDFQCGRLWCGGLQKLFN